MKVGKEAQLQFEKAQKMDVSQFL